MVIEISKHQQPSKLKLEKGCCIFKFITIIIIKRRKIKEITRRRKKNEGEDDGPFDRVNWCNPNSICLLTNLHITNSMHHTWPSCSHVGFAHRRRSHIFLMASFLFFCSLSISSFFPL